jgi:hypothetical protein
LGELRDMVACRGRPALGAKQDNIGRSIPGGPPQDTNRPEVLVSLRPGRDISPHQAVIRGGRVSPRRDLKQWWHTRIRDARSPTDQFALPANYMRAVLKRAPDYTADEIIPRVADVIRDAADELTAAPQEPEGEDGPPEGLMYL